MVENAMIERDALTSRLSAPAARGELHFREADHTYWLVTPPDDYGRTTEARHVPNVTTIIEAAGFADFSMVRDDVLERARIRGRDLHLARHLLDAGRLDWSTVSDEIGAYLECYLAWRGMFPGDVIFSERPLYHGVYGYAGTPDLVLELARPHKILGSRVLIDTKGGVQISGHELQTAAYEALYNVNARALERLTGRAALYLSRDGKPARLVPHREASDFRAFTAAHQLYEWRKKHHGRS